MSNKVMEQLTNHKIVPVVVVNKIDTAKDLGNALVAGGLPVAEVTFRTEAAPEAIRIMAENPDLIVGAGTVLTADQVKVAADNGAKFIVSPGFNPAVVEAALALDLLVLPGGVTPTEITSILNFDLNTIKFFPANVYGGVNALKSLSAPFTNARFIPTGGVNPENVNQYLSLPCVVAAGGSWMVPGKLVDAYEFEAVQKLIAEAVTVVK